MVSDIMWHPVLVYEISKWLEPGYKCLMADSQIMLSITEKKDLNFSILSSNSLMYKLYRVIINFSHLA